MRNPERIDKILKELEIYWKSHPDMRLSQIVLNFASSIVPKPLRCISIEYQYEDDSLLKDLEKANSPTKL